MRVFGGILLGALTALGCGDASGPGGSRSLQACAEICSLPDECFEQLDVPTEGVDCFDACEEQIEVVGVACIEAITDAINCLPSCDVEELTDEELLACQDEALAIGPACDG